MNVNSYNTTDYENKSNWTFGENKPNSNPNKPNFGPISRVSKPKQTQFKPNLTKGQNWCKVCIYKGLRRKMRLRAMKKQSQNKPCPERSEFTLSVIEGNGPISVKKCQNKLLLWFGVVNDIIYSVITSDWFGLSKGRFENWIWGRTASTGWRTDKLHAQDAGWPG